MPDKKEIQTQEFEILAEDCKQAKAKVQNAIIELATVIEKALDTLGEKNWIQWLKDSRVNLNKSQAYKFVAISKHCKHIQLTGCIKNKQIEKAYLLTTLNDETRRQEMANKIIDADFTVKEVRQAIKYVNENNLPADTALEEAKKIVSQPKPKEHSKTVPLEDYKKVLEENEKLRFELAKYQQKTESLEPEEIQEDEVLAEPVKSDLPDETVNPKRKSIVYKGYELPIPPAFNPNDENVNKIRQAAVNNAKNNHNLDLTV